MKTSFKSIATVLCIIGSMYTISGCTESSFLPEDNTSQSNQPVITRTNGDSPYYFYNHENKKVHLSLNTASAFYSVKESVVPIDQSAGIAKFGAKALEFKTDNSTKKRFKGAVATKRLYTELNFGNRLSDEKYLALLSDIRTQNQEVIVEPYFNDEYGNKIGLSNFFYVKLNREEDVDTLEKTAIQTGCIIVSQDEFMPLWYKLSVTEATEKNTLECANIFYESGLFAAAEPDLMADISCTKDTYIDQQWGLSSEYTKAANAWLSSTGSNIVVAVIDYGIDLLHPDLAANIHPLSYDCDDNATPQELRGSHGTAVAGIIGAVKDNGIGVAGVAPDCQLMSISSCLSSTLSSTLKEQLARGINWAWLNGADVINCSWGHATALSGAYITDAISNASLYGRRGKGSVVVVSSGNENASSVCFPASLGTVLAVGAMDQSYFRDFLSNYGDELNVVAPGVGIYTTDIQGSSGYATGDYCSFSRTSAAAPFASGVAALVLSSYPNLSEFQVRMVIQKSCTWLPSYSGTFKSYLPNRRWNREIGYGMVNASAALLEAHNETLLDILKSTPAIDFKITNNSSYVLDNIYIELTGNVGSSYATLIQQDPGGVYAGGIMEGFPDYAGYSLNAAPGTAITNLRLELLAYSRGSQLVTVTVLLDGAPNQVNTSTNFSGGNTINLSLPDSSVPKSSRRTLNILISPY